MPSRFSLNLVNNWLCLKIRKVSRSKRMGQYNFCGGRRTQNISRAAACLLFFKIAIVDDSRERYSVVGIQWRKWGLPPDMCVKKGDSGYSKFPILFRKQIFNLQSCPTVDWSVSASTTTLRIAPYRVQKFDLYPPLPHFCICAHLRSTRSCLDPSTSHPTD
jgi:hypothetical protein